MTHFWRCQLPIPMFNPIADADYIKICRLLPILINLMPMTHFLALPMVNPNADQSVHHYYLHCHHKTNYFETSKLKNFNSKLLTLKIFCKTYKCQCHTVLAPRQVWRCTFWRCFYRLKTSDAPR